jgi:hypothetical protein
MYQSLRIGRVLFIYWRDDVVTLEDARGIMRLVPDSRRDAGKELIYVAVATGTTPPPSDEVRKLMAGTMDDVLKSCETMHLVFEGTGFRHTVQRMAMVSIMLMAGKRSRIFIESSLDEAIRNAPLTLRKELSSAVHGAVERGFFPGSASIGAF